MDTNLAKDYIVQWPRFQVDEGFGCGTSPDGSVLSILLVYSWTVLLPLISVVVYYRASRPSAQALYVHQEGGEAADGNRRATDAY